MRKTLSFLFLWLFWGFTVGTVVLLLPVRLIVDYGKAHALSEQAEDRIVICFMVLTAVASGAIAWFSQRQLSQRHLDPNRRVLLTVVPLVTGLVSFYIFLHPNLINGPQPEETLSAPERDAPVLFTLGAYPDEDKMIQLRKQGYTHIVSLLHEAVPFETRLLAEEREHAYQQGIELTNLPMLPWISNNEESIRRIRELVRHAKGHYYIHCYQGRDRANVVRRIIDQESAELVSQKNRIAPHSIRSLDSFERGRIVLLDSGTYLTPKPTEEEYFGYVIAGDFKSVVILNDPANPYDPQELEQEKSSLGAYGIPYSVVSLPASATGAPLDKALRQVQDMPRPVLIHGRRTDEPAARLLTKAYGSGHLARR